MEKQIIGRGLLAGALAGVLAFVFAKIFIEPIIGRAIDFEDGVGAAHEAMETAAGGHEPRQGGELFTRGVQSNIGMGLGVLAFSVAMGALFAVVFCVAYGRVGNVSARTLSVLVAGGHADLAVDRACAEVPAESAGHQPRRDHQTALPAVPADGGAVGAPDGRRGLPRSPAEREAGRLECDAGRGGCVPRRGAGRDAGAADHQRDARSDASTTRATSSSPDSRRATSTNSGCTGWPPR